MPFRFRKGVSLGKGFRLNLSKGGISSTFGTKGLHLNVGKRGVRPTVGIPGSGVSFTPSTSNKRTGQAVSNIIAVVIIVIVICVIAVCCIGFVFFNIGNINSTMTPTLNNVSTLIMQTANAALIQTQAASSPTLNITSTFLPTLTLPATLTPSQTNEPTATVLFIFPTAPASGGGGGVCPCSGDTLNCKDFSSQASAQACMNSCIAQGAGDIHNLDGDANGKACEGLP